jgi:hypothetical protein
MNSKLENKNECGCKLEKTETYTDQTICEQHTKEIISHLLARLNKLNKENRNETE